VQFTRQYVYHCRWCEFAGMLACSERDIPTRSRRFASAAQPPRTQTEQVLAVIWGEVLKLDQVGIEDNFFDLGGHSLLATQVVSRIRSAFAIDLALWELFASPTIVEITAILDRNRVKHTSDIALARMLGEVEAMTEEGRRDDRNREKHRIEG